MIEFEKSIDFVTIYISEAHPIDEWHVHSEITFCQPRTMEERVKLAFEFQEKYQVEGPLVVDLMDNRVDLMFSALPERLYVVLDRKIVYVGGVGPFHYSLSSLKQWIKDFKKN